MRVAEKSNPLQWDHAKQVSESHRAEILDEMEIGWRLLDGRGWKRRKEIGGLEISSFPQHGAQTTL
jgi:hypothetical protein